MNKCKNCGLEITADMKFCASCGSPVDSIVEAEAVAVDNKSVPSPTLCKSCGAEVTPDMLFCAVCGTSTKHTETAVAENNITATQLSTTCKNCGSELTAEMIFCTLCGTPTNHKSESQPQIINEKPPRSRNSRFNFKQKKYIIPAVSVTIAIIALFIIINLVTPANYELIKGSLCIARGNNSVVVIPNGKPKVEMDGALVSSQINLYSTKGAVLIAEDGDDYWDYWEDGFSLYFIDDRPQFVSDGVSTFWLAASGDAIAYIKDVNYDNNNAELWYYSAGNNTRLTSNISLDYPYYYCTISPDGKTVAYATLDGDKCTGIVWDGKPTELGRDIIPIAISDGAKYIYYAKNDSIFVQQGLNSDLKEKLIEDSSSVLRTYSNMDLSQIVFETNSRSYISVKGGSRESLPGSINRLIMPDGTAVFHTTYVTICGFSDFANKFYLTNDNAIVYINRKYETNSIVRNISDAYLSNDGKTLYYLRSGSIYMVNGSDANAEAIEVVKGSVGDFVLTADGKAVFYINYDDEIYYQKGNNKSTTVSMFFTSSTDSWYTNYGLFNGNTFFYIDDGDLYFSTGDKGRTVDVIQGSVRDIRVEYSIIYVTSFDKGDTFYYISTDGIRFDVIRQDYGPSIAVISEIYLNDSVNVNIASAQQKLYYSFTPSSNGSYTFESYDNGNCDPIGKLYDSNLSTLATDDDGGYSGNFKITHYLTRGQIYYIEVGCYEDGTGSYSLTVYTS